MNCSYSISELVEALSEQGCLIEVRGSDSLMINGLATLSNAEPHHLSFLANPKYKRDLQSSQAGACLLTEAEADDFLGVKLICENPYVAYSFVTHLFCAKGQIEAGIHQSAVIDASAIIAESARIGPNVVIGAHANVGQDAVIGANTVIGKNVQMGSGCRLYPNVTLYEDVKLGDRVVIHSGAVLGSDGFGFAHQQGEWLKIAQLGGVTVGNDVEIGASTTIDAGAIEDTRIGHGVIIDNQVQLAHNVKIGDHTAIAGCVGIAGSTSVGKYCTIAGAAGLAGHLTICDKVHISMQAQVTRSISQPGSYSSGTGLLPTKQWRKAAVYFRQLERWVKRSK